MDTGHRRPRRGQARRPAGSPAVVFSTLAEPWRGSARSAGDVDLGALFAANAALFERYGGHAAAAGCHLASDRYEAFRTAMSAALDSPTRCGRGPHHGAPTALAGPGPRRERRFGRPSTLGRPAAAPPWRRGRATGAGHRRSVSLTRPPRERRSHPVDPAQRNRRARRHLLRTDGPRRGPPRRRLHRCRRAPDEQVVRRLRDAPARGAGCRTAGWQSRTPVGRVPGTGGGSHRGPGRTHGGGGLTSDPRNQGQQPQDPGTQGWPAPGPDPSTQAWGAPPPPPGTQGRQAPPPGTQAWICPPTNPGTQAVARYPVPPPPPGAMASRSQCSRLRRLAATGRAAGTRPPPTSAAGSRSRRPRAGHRRPCSRRWWHCSGWCSSRAAR